MANALPPYLRSAGYLGANVTGHPPAGFGSVTHLMWPAYERLTSAHGGDVSASFSFVDVAGMYEYWLEEGIGQTLRETYDGQTAFLGRLAEVRAAIGRISLKVALADVFNKVACYYTSVITGQSALSAYAEDAASQAQWGVRVLHFRPSQPMDAGEADDTAAEILRRISQPRIVRGPLQGNLTAPVCKLSFEGFALALDAEMYYEPSPGSEPASDHVATVLAGASLVTAGSITANDLPVPIQSDYRGRLQRLHWLAERRDALGRDYRYGCFGSQTWEYAPIEPLIRYRIAARQPAYEVEDVVAGFTVPAPLVQPGFYSLAHDILPSRPVGPVEEDFRVQLDVTVKYGANGAIPTPRDWSAEDRAESIAMAIYGGRYRQ